MHVRKKFFFCQAHAPHHRASSVCFKAKEKPRRLALVSDIHGNLAALEAVIADLRTRKIDRVVNLGDSLSGPLVPEQTAHRLRELPWLHVAGNHERQVLNLPRGQLNASDAFTDSQLSPQSRQWLALHIDAGDRRLHEARMWPDVLGHEVALCHGSPRSVRHNGLLIVNHGSVGLPAYEDDHPTALASRHCIETGSTDVR
jgi:predicted phosphodiesterase